MVTHDVCFFQVLEVNIIAESKFATFSNSTFIIYYDFNIDFKPDWSVKGLLIQLSVTKYHNIRLVHIRK